MLVFATIKGATAVAPQVTDTIAILVQAALEFQPS